MTPAEEFLAEFQRAVAASLAAMDQEVGPPPTRRIRAARHVGQAGWTLGDWLVRATRWAHDRSYRAADRITDAGDALANRIAGPR